MLHGITDGHPVLSVMFVSHVAPVLVAAPEPRLAGPPTPSRQHMLAGTHGRAVVQRIARTRRAEPGEARCTPGRPLPRVIRANANRARPKLKAEERRIARGPVGYASLSGRGQALCGGVWHEGVCGLGSGLTWLRFTGLKTSLCTVLFFFLS